MPVDSTFLDWYGIHTLRGRAALTFEQVQHAISGPFVALALYGPDAIAHWRRLIGPTHVFKTQWTHPESLRARYGLSDTRNGFHGELQRRPAFAEPS